jgi:hypothetical protein
MSKQTKVNETSGKYRFENIFKRQIIYSEITEWKKPLEREPLER